MDRATEDKPEVDCSLKDIRYVVECRPNPSYGELNRPDVRQKFSIVVDCSDYFIYHSRPQHDHHDPHHHYDEIQANLYFDKRLITTLFTNGKEGLTHITFDGETLEENDFKPFRFGVQVSSSYLHSFRVQPVLTCTWRREHDLRFGD